jgi:hypothetical protein
VLLKEILPEAAPLDWGVNLTNSDLCWPAAMINGNEIPLRLNSGLFDVAEEILTLDPLAVKVVVRFLVVPTATLPKFKVAGPKANRPAELPLPTSATLNVEFGALEITERYPLSLEVDLGEKMVLKV